MITESTAIDDQAGLLMWWRHVECQSCSCDGWEVMGTVGAVGGSVKDAIHRVIKLSEDFDLRM